MPRRRIRSRFFAALTASSLLAACGSVPPGPEQGPAFALMGDTPYDDSQVPRLDALVQGLNREPLAFVAHVGDITSGRGPCTDEWFMARKAQFDRIRAPFFLLPGDNDWTDCHRSGFDPLERLAKWRSLFCLPEKSLPPLRVERQAGPYCEHVRWTFERTLFVALNVQGTNNNLGRTPAMDEEYRERMERVFAWIDDSEKALVERRLDALVLLMQADPFLAPRSGESGFASLLERLGRLAAAHPGRVTLVHGDSHVHRDDFPLPGLHRVEVWGSPFVSWLRGRIASGGLDAEVAGQY